MPHTVPGCLHPSNGRNAIDWNDGGLIAYGSHNVLHVVDVLRYKRIQCIELHQSAINIVRWAPARSSFSEFSTCQPIIASSSISGHIIVSNATTAAQINQFSHPNTSVLQMFWYPWKDISRDFLLVLHSSNTLVLWNTATGEKVWCHIYSHVPLFDFTIDPFSIRNVIFSSSGNKVLVCSDITLSEPVSSGHLFQVVSEDVTSSSSPSNTNIYLITYHKAYRNTVLIAINSSLYLVNPELMCCLSRIPIESNIVSWMPCSRRDALFAVHSNGATTFRITKFEPAEEKKPNASFSMDKVCQTECVRPMSAQKIVAAALCPTTQSTVCVLYQNGKLAFWQLSNGRVPLLYRACFIEDFLEFNENLDAKAIGDLSLHQLNQMGSLSSGVTCVRMRPIDELTKVENDPFANTALGTLHLAAVGTNSGVVHLVDVFTSQIYRDFSVQPSIVKCLEWGGVYSLVTAGYNLSLSASQVVRNDVFITDIRTGLARRIRPEADESPITLIRVSYYHCYLALAFQREPLEIWDLKGLRMLRKMSRNCPLIIDMAWSNKHHGIKTTESTLQSVYRENLVLLDSENRIYHITLRGLHVRDGKMVNTQWKSSSAQICAMTWKDDMLAVGDVEGNLVVWDLGRKQSRQVRDVSHSRVLRMTFSRLAGDHTMAVLHSKEVTLWDTEAMTRIQSIRMDASKLCLDLDLCGLSPLVLTNDNSLRFVVSNAKNQPISDKEMPLIYQEDSISTVRKRFESSGSRKSSVERNGVEKTDEDTLEDVLSWLETNNAAPIIENLEVDLTKLRIERTVRRFMGDHFSADLLSIVIDRFAPSETNHLPSNLQMFWENSAFKERESRVISIACAAEEAMERRLVEQAVVVGGAAKERVTDRLIVSPDLRYASIKAALLVSCQENEKAKSLIKLIATNLIASDLIEDGVELLFLVGAGADACKYLQSQKQWTKSIVYAKMGLDDPSEVESKWIGHLVDEAKQTRVLADASRRNWPDVVEAMSSADSVLARLILRTTTTTPPISSCPTP
uniref:WD repeat-containing protein 11 n=1 Tax=Caenorhabditis japonica TaxID=281687 RepID=A0A8R1I657_CAEJA